MMHFSGRNAENDPGLSCLAMRIGPVKCQSQLTAKYGMAAWLFTLSYGGQIVRIIRGMRPT